MSSTQPASDAPECPNGFHPLRWEDAADPFAKLKELRARCPISTVRFEPLPPMKFFTRFDDIIRIYRDWESFGNMGVGINAEAHNAEPVQARSIIQSDPPRHDAMRRFALLALSPARVNRHMAEIEEYARGETAKLPKGEEFDLMDRWAGPIPSVAIGRVLGLPDEDALGFKPVVRMGIEMIARTMSPSSPDFVWESGAGHDAPAPAFPEPADFVGRWVRARRGDPDPPTDDLLARMLEFVDPDTGISFTDEEVIAQIVTIIAAGNDTTGGAIGNMVYRMCTVPGLWQSLNEDRSKIGSAIEESLRFDPVQMMFPRICLKDTEVSGVPVKAGEVIIVSMASGNRDEDVYGADADEFNYEREFPNPRHLSMGRGIHTCVGAYLARHVMRVSIEALLDAATSMKLAPGYEYEKVLFHHFRAPQRLPVIIGGG